jgi:CubicO group peptidase (beta-lactamase class C family)
MGSWNGRELIPGNWVKELVTQTSGAEDVHGYEKWRLGYGKLWWLFDDQTARTGGALQGAYCAVGAYGQYIAVVPKLDIVIAHKVVHEVSEDVGVSAFRQFVDLVVAARH